MDIQQIIMRPITTPEYPDPIEALRYVDNEDGFYGHDYVFLEDATWHALSEIANERGCTIGQLCSHIDLNFAKDEPFAAAARRYVLCYLADIPGNIELPGNSHVLRDLLAAHRHAIPGSIDQPARLPETSLYDR